MKIAILSIGHFDVLFSLLMKLKNNWHTDIILIMDINRPYESIIDLRKHKINLGFNGENLLKSIFRGKMPELFSSNFNFKIFLFSNPKLRSIKNIYLAFKLLYFLKKRNYDIVHINGVHSILRIIVPFFKKKIITTMHDYRPHYGEIKNLFNKLINLDNYLLKKSVYFILQNKYDYDKVLKQQPDLKSKIVMNPFSKLIIYHCYENGQKLDNVDLLFFGRITKYKGIDFLINAIKLLKIRGYELNTVIAGAGKLNFSQDFLKELKITIINKYLDNYELVNLIKACKIIVCPYLDTTQSGVLMTSLTFNKPCIVTKAGSLGEVIHNNKNGVLLQKINTSILADAIFKLHTDTDLQNRIISNLENFENEFEDYNWENIASKYLVLYKNAVESNVKR